MQFTTVIGKIDKDLVEKAEQKLNQVIGDFCQPYKSGQGTGLGGDPFIYAMLYPIQHVCTLNIPTAGTDGKRYYWNPKFILKKSYFGLRFVAYHEAAHAIYMHPARRSTRIPQLWNIAVDYIVNSMIMDDLKTRGRNAAEEFEKHLGKYMTLDKYAEFLKDPFKDGKSFEPSHIKNQQIEPDLDRELTQEELDNLEKEEKREKFFFADDNLKEEFKSPENIYDMLFALLPKCPKCGRVGVYKKPKSQGQNDQKDQGAQAKGQKDGKKDKKKGKKKSQNQKDDSCPQHGDKSKDKGDQKGDQSSDQGQEGQDGENGENPSDDHGHGGDKPCTCPNDHGQQGDQGDGQSDQESTDGCDQDGKGCGECGGGDTFDIFDAGGTLDDHMDVSEEQEKIAKRVAEAVDMVKKMAGRVPAGIEAELGKLVEPKMRWQDAIRIKKAKARMGNKKNDYTRFKSRAMFGGMLLPKKTDFKIRFGCLMDTSGSMSEEDILFGISQLKSLDEKTEGWIVPADSAIYWDDATYIRKISDEELKKTKVVGRGGTMFGEFTSKYEEYLGKCDFLIFITDGYLIDSDVAAMKNPGIDVVWILTANSSFVPPFGKAYMLR